VKSRKQGFDKSTDIYGKTKDSDNHPKEKGIPGGRIRIPKRNFLMGDQRTHYIVQHPKFMARIKEYLNISSIFKTEEKKEKYQTEKKNPAWGKNPPCFEFFSDTKHSNPYQKILISIQTEASITRTKHGFTGERI